jgi:hypothetical protein
MKTGISLLQTSMVVSILAILFFTGKSVASAQPAENTEKPAPAPTAKSGLTFMLNGSFPVSGISQVGCNGPDGSKCNPYEGDSSCDIARPLLCFLDLDAPIPASLPVGNNKNKWSGGVMATTPEMAGSAFSTITDADNYCSKEFGKGWKVARFDQGKGWNFRAYGNVGDPKVRMWVEITDQKNGACWKR